MKKLMLIAFAALTFVACNDTETEETTTEMENTTSTTTGYSPVDGDVSYRENKVMVRRNNEWEEANEDTRLDNGVIVRRDGTAVRDGNEVRLEDGVIVTRTGDFFDRSGRAIENAWDATKEGVKDAGRAVGDAAKRVGEEVDEAVTDDKKEKKN